MAITKDEALLNLMNTLDNFFASMRMTIDNLDYRSSTQILNSIRCQNYGKTISIFNKGIIFGLTPCQIRDLGETWGMEFGSSYPDESLLKDENLHDWIITRGNIFHNNKIINIEPEHNKPYSYKIHPHITEKMESYLIPGTVLYSTITDLFRTTLMGQQTINHPINGIEKNGMDINKLIQLNYKYFTECFRETISGNDVLICRFIVDVSSIDSYELYVLNSKDTYPFIYGQPYQSFMIFAQNIYNCIEQVLEDGYDSDLIYNLMYYIVNAETWGIGTNAFYTYWTTGGRTLPPNVKYYYNILFTPIIP